jgi:hypothetical protein
VRYILLRHQPHDRRREERPDQELALRPLSPRAQAQSQLRGTRNHWPEAGCFHCESSARFDFRSSNCFRRILAVRLLAASGVGCKD